MRIALVIERFEPRGGGAEAVAWRVAHGLAAAGDEVHVCVRVAPGGGDSETPAPALPVGIALHRLRVAKGWQPRRVWQFSRAAAAATKALGCDVVQTFSRTRHQDVFRAGGGCHASYMERTYRGLGRTWRRASPRHALALAIDAAVFGDPAQHILCNSTMVRDEIADRYRVATERLSVIVNGVDAARFQPRPEGALPDREGAERVWLLVGSGFVRKGVDTALAALARRPTDEALWIAGSDAPAPWMARARALGLDGRVRFLGRRDDLPDLYRRADALFLPTRYDAFANVCLEAAASGLPVLTSGANGAAGWIRDGGLVVADPEDAGAFAEALGTLRDPVRADAMGRAARARAEAATWERHIAALRALYRRVCE